MRSSSLVRASSTRNICIFCATRGSADGIIPSIRRSSIAQRRNLHHSSNSSQSASVARLRDDESRPPSSTSTAGGWGQPYGAAAAAPSAGLTPGEQRIKDNLQRQREQAAAIAAKNATAPRPSVGLTPEEQRVRDHLQRQRAQHAAPGLRNSPTTQRQGRREYGFNQLAGRGQYDSTSKSSEARYVVRRATGLNRGPAPAEESSFTPENASNWTHLKRRGEGAPRVHAPAPTPSVAGAESKPRDSVDEFLQSLEKTTPPPRRRQERPKLDDDEIKRLLSGATGRGDNQLDSREARPYVPLARESVGGVRCFRCGESGHKGRDCPNITQFVPASRLKNVGQNPGFSQPFQEGRQNYDRPDTTASASSEAASIVSATDVYDEDKRAATEAWKRRSARFGQKEEEVVTRGNDRRRAGRGRISRSMEDDEVDEGLDRAHRKRQRKEERKRVQQMAKTSPTPVQLPEYISVTNLASALKVRVEDFVRKLEELGFEDVQNDHILNAENSALVAMEYNFEPVIQKAEEDVDLYPAPLPEDISVLPSRPPVVTIMGHVDHGKTTILDFLRNSSVAASEFGGITQHIGAFSVPLESGKTITFLDTPGHAAFLSMRQRGANVTDIVILVVAADDSVKPQTIEAIKHAQSAAVPIIVAINKIDKEEANPDRVKQDLARHGVDVEDYGGETQVVCVSGKTGTGMPELEEAVVTLSEILDHRADPEGPVEGWVLEGTTRKSGRVATLLIRRGTLHVGDILVAGKTWARVRTLKNEAGAAIDAVGPGMPVEVDGWREQPLAGDEVLQAPDEQKASAVSEYRADAEERIRLAKDMEAINESRRLEAERAEKEKAVEAARDAGEDDNPAEKVAKSSGPEIISFIVKADVSGSVEAVTDSIAPLGNSEVGCTILRSGVGPPSEFDVVHAAAAKGHIINFNTSIPPQIAALAEEKGVRLLDSNIIYRLSEDVRALLSERLPPNVVKRVTGEAEVAQAFSVSVGGRKKMMIAGSKVRNGTMKRGALVRVVRGETTVYEGTLSSLKNVKKDVAEMPKNSECGIGFEEWEAFEVGDKVQCYEESTEKRYL